MGSKEWASLAKEVGAAIPGDDPSLISRIEDMERENRALKRMAQEVERTVQTASNGGHPWTLERWLRVLGVASLILTGVISWTWLLSNKWRDITSAIAAMTAKIGAVETKVDAVKGQTDRMEYRLEVMEDTARVDAPPSRRATSPSRGPAFPRDSQLTIRSPSSGAGSR